MFWIEVRVGVLLFEYLAPLFLLANCPATFNESSFILSNSSFCKSELLSNERIGQLASTLEIPYYKLSLFSVYLEQYANGVLNSEFKRFKFGGCKADVNNLKIDDKLFDLNPKCIGANSLSHLMFGFAPNFIKYSIN
jgi:hypothetical protein